jgi:hypothetical protein
MDLARLAYEASLRSLDKQEHLVQELRSRTGLLLAASSLAASFLGESALDGSILLATPALIAFAVSVGASLYVLLPSKNLVFSFAGSRMYEELLVVGTIHDAHRLLAYDLDRYWGANDAIVASLLRGFRLATIALAVEIVLLLASVGATIV